MNQKNKKKVCLFFNHDRGLNVFNYLIKNKNYEVSKVFLSKKNLKRKIIPIIKKSKYSYSIVRKVNSKKVLNFIIKNKIDFNIICGFPYIFNNKLLNSSKYGTLNLHGGKLPNYKGASTLNWQIINGEKKIGISIIQANTSIDGGDILTQSNFKLRENHDIKKVHQIVNKKFPILLSNVLKKLLNKKLNPKKNKNGKIYKQRKPSDGKIFWDKMTNIQVFNFIRALTLPYPGAFSFEKLSKKKIIFFKSKKSNLNPSIKPGTVFFKKKNIFVKSKKSSLQILKSSNKLINKSLLN